VNTRLLTPADRGAGYSFEFNFEGLLRADSVARAQLMSTLAQNGLRTRNELRKIDNYPAIPGADALTAQTNLVPLERLGEQQQQATVARNALRSGFSRKGRQHEQAQAPGPSADHGPRRTGL
jgi:hypothetical protein